MSGSDLHAVLSRALRPAVHLSRVIGGVWLVVGVLLAAGTPTAAHASATGARSASSTAGRSTTTTDPNAPVPVGESEVPPAGRRVSSHRVLAISRALPVVRRLRARDRGSYDGAYLKGPVRWQYSLFSRSGKEVAQVIIDDRSARVLEQWTGFQVAWTMARGYPGSFGRRANAWWVWLPLSVLFVVPFFDRRRPWRLLHMDLLVLTLFGVSLAFFNHGRIGLSVPLAYPPLLYVLVRALVIARPRLRRTRGGEPPGEDVAPGDYVAPRAGVASAREPLPLLVPASWLAVGTVFLIGFRLALNVVDANVIDVGYAGVIGAHRVVHAQSLYGGWPSDNEHGDTYGPVSYEAYVPAVALTGWNGRWNDLPSAHLASVVFDLLAVAGLFLLGRRVRGPTMGVALAYAWVAFPFTLYALACNTNDSLVGALVIAALLAASRPRLRGALGALAGLTKFAPLALAPLLALHRAPGAPARSRLRTLGAFTVAFVVTAAVVSIPAVTHNDLQTVWERTFVYQADRGSPFSVWGLWGGLSSVQAAVEVAALLLAVALALVPRRADVVGLAAAAAAILVAVQLGADHWFYLYIPWFFAPLIVALLARFGEPTVTRGAPSAAARSRRLVAA